MVESEKVSAGGLVIDKIDNAACIAASLRNRKPSTARIPVLSGIPTLHIHT